MKKNVFTLVLGFSLILLFLSSCAKDEEVLTGTISGFVSDYTNANAPIAGATVTINSKGLTKTTGSDGRFEFSSLEPGTYSISISANNYQPTTKQVTVYAGQKANCDVQLEKAGASVEISPMNLSFGQGVEQLSFTIKNNGNQSLTYSISNAPDYIEVSPNSGTVAAKGNQAVSVHVKERSSITSNRSGQITVNVGNDSYIVSFNISNSTTTDPNQGQGDDNTQNGDVAITRSLLAYYTFDNNTPNNSYRTTNNGTITGEAKYVNDTPNGKGKALSLETKEYVTIPNNLVEQKAAFSISMWVKNFGTGPLFTTMSGSYPQAPSIFILSDNKPRFYHYGGSYANMSYSLESIQSSGWHMITYTASYSDRQVVLYVDGNRVDNKAISDVESRGNKMQIGGNGDGYFDAWADPMIVDNVRIHSITLTDNEVKQIYNAEK